MNWKNLSVQDRANYIKLGVQNGITDLNSIIDSYNQYKNDSSMPSVTSEEKVYYDSPVRTYSNGGYKPSDSIKKRISTWEGSSMKTNRPFEVEALAFNKALPAGATNKLSQEQLDGLYSYSYNVGSGNFKKRVSPVLERYLAGQATAKDVQNSMWASGDTKYRGLAKRRAIERQMFRIPGISDPVTNMMIANLPSKNEFQVPTQEIPQLSFGNLTQPTSTDVYKPTETPIDVEEYTTNPLVEYLGMLQNVKSNNYYAPNYPNNRFDEGGSMSTMDKIKIGASFLPVVGTLMDLKELWDHPSWENAGWAALSVGSDLLGASLLKGAAKASKAAAKTAKIARDNAKTYREYSKAMKQMSKARHIEGMGYGLNTAVNTSANGIQVGYNLQNSKKEE